MTHSTAIILSSKPYSWIKDFPPCVEESPELEQRVREKWGKLFV